MPKKFILFLLAAFSLTQVRLVGSIGISELVMLVVGPVFAFREWKNLKRDGFVTLMILALLWLASALVTDLYRGTTLENMLKGIAHPIMIFSIIPCFYVLMKDDLSSFKWALIGFCVTTILSMYVFQTGYSVAVAETQGISAQEAALGYKLANWAIVSSIIVLIPSICYLSWPVVSTVITACLAVFALFEGGRSGFLAMLFSVLLMVMAGGRRMRVKRLGKHALVLVILLGLTTFVAKKGYEYTVTHGYMGEDEFQKYEAQSQSKIGLLSGRSQFLVCFYAIRDSPILGFGSWALDWQGYNLKALEFLEDDEAIEKYLKTGEIAPLGAHSCLMTAYLWHGLAASFFWIYVLWLIVLVIRKYLGSVPACFGYLALSLPSLMWSVLFSPFGGRVNVVFILILCLFARRQGNMKAWREKQGLPDGGVCCGPNVRKGAVKTVNPSQWL